MNGEKIKINIPMATAALILIGYLVWNFNAWAGHQTRITVVEIQMKTHIDHFTNAVDRIEASINKLLEAKR